ncbi:hypothetical protein Tco_1218649 [Tanacetum coccineum]
MKLLRGRRNRRIEMQSLLQLRGSIRKLRTLPLLNHHLKLRLFGTTSSKFLPTSLREQTPPKDSSKGKAIAIIEEPRNELVQFQEEGRSNPKAPNLKPFTTLEGPLSQEEFDKQIKELKRISDLKAEKEKSEQELRKLLNPATLKAQAQKWTKHEAKKAKMMEEYNY